MHFLKEKKTWLKFVYFSLCCRKHRFTGLWIFFIWLHLGYIRCFLDRRSFYIPTLFTSLFKFFSNFGPRSFSFSALIHQKHQIYHHQDGCCWTHEVGNDWQAANVPENVSKSIKKSFMNVISDLLIPPQTDLYGLGKVRFMTTNAIPPFWIAVSRLMATIWGLCCRHTQAKNAPNRYPRAPKNLFVS